MTLKLPKYQWSDDYGVDLTFQKIRKRFFPPFPDGIFYSCQDISSAGPEGSHKTHWLSTLGVFAQRQKLFMMEGEAEFCDHVDNPKWILTLEAGEYGEIPGGDYRFRYLSDSRTLFYRVFERPPKEIMDRLEVEEKMITYQPI